MGFAKNACAYGIHLSIYFFVRNIFLQTYSRHSCEKRAKCQKVADAFAELYEMADIVVLDVGRYGFVMLKYYTPPHGFEEDATTPAFIPLVLAKPTLLTIHFPEHS